MTYPQAIKIAGMGRYLPERVVPRCCRGAVRRVVHDRPVNPVESLAGDCVEATHVLPAEALQSPFDRAVGDVLYCGNPPAGRLVPHDETHEFGCA